MFQIDAMSREPVYEQIIHQVEQVRIAFFEQLFQGFSQEELKQYADFSKRIMENVLKGSKK